MSDKPQRPTFNDRAAWRAYLQVQGTLWRTAPGVDEGSSATGSKAIKDLMHPAAEVLRRCLLPCRYPGFNAYKTRTSVLSG